MHPLLVLIAFIACVLGLTAGYVDLEFASPQGLDNLSIGCKLTAAAVPFVVGFILLLHSQERKQDEQEED
jgi:hypothetical protein